jgi:hypothetical protein
MCDRTHDGDCRILDNGYVLCHTHLNGVDPGKRHPERPFIYCGHSDEAQGFGKWLPEHLDDPSKKAPREPLDHFWIYRCWDGSDFPVRRKRSDTPGKDKWVGWETKFPEGRRQAEIAPLHWHETEQQRAAGEFLFVVKGELKAEQLTDAGFACISTLDPTERLISELRGVKSQVVLAPDCDLADLNHWYRELSQQLPEARTLLPSLKGMNWRNPPENGGLGVEDWLQRSKPDAEAITAAIVSTPWKSEAEPNGHCKVHQLTSPEEQAEERQERSDALTSYLRKRDGTFDVLSLFPEFLGEQLKLRAASFPVDPVMLVPPLLSICASIYGKRGKVRVKGTWKEPLIIWVGTVAEPSALKSPVASAMMAPLKRIYAESLERHRQVKAEYDEAAEDTKKQRDALKAQVQGIQKRKITPESKAELAAAQAAMKELGDPEPPASPREYFVKSVTWAKLGEICQQPSTKGLVNYRDELESWFNELDRDPQLRSDWLELWPGECIKLDRKVADSAFSEETAVSIFGNTTPDNIRARIGTEYEEDQQAGDGMWCRLLWCFPPHVTPVWTDDDHSINDILGSVYRGIDELPEGDISVSAQAKEMLAAMSTQYAKDATDSDSARAAFIGKLRGYLWRFAGLLNVIDRGCDPTASAEVTPDQAMRAVDLASWFMDQFDLLMPLVGRGQLPSWSGPLIDLARKSNGEVGLRDICRKFTCSKDEAMTKVQTLVEEFGCGDLVTRARGRLVWIAPAHLLSEEAK